MENVPLVKEDLKSNTLSENSNIAEMLELCIQPKTGKELENIQLDFSERLTALKCEDIQEFDVLSFYALNYVYEHETSTLSALSRSLYVYQEQHHMLWKEKNRNMSIDCERKCFLKMLRGFTNLYTFSKSEELLVDIGLCSILSANLGLARFLVKFGLIEFPSEVNTKCKKMFETLVNMFNDCSQQLAENLQAEHMKTSVELEELLNKMKEETNIRRCIFTFSTIVIVAEYHMHSKLEELWIDFKFLAKHKKNLCFQKLKCLDLFIQATSESIITFKDIENFIEAFLNPFLSMEIGKTLIETSRKVLGEVYNYYNPRFLKDLARSMVRSSLRNSMTIPEQVNELEIPVALKNFLTFHSEGIWDLLLMNHTISCIEKKICGIILVNRNEPVAEAVNEPVAEAVNDPELEAVRDPELRD